MYPIMGGQLGDLYRSLREAYNTYEQMEQANRQAELFRQHQEQYGGRAISPQAQAQKEHLVDAWGSPEKVPAWAQQQWTATWTGGKIPWGEATAGFRTGETRAGEQRGRAEIMQDMRQVRQDTLRAISSIQNDPQLFKDPARKAAAIQTVREAASSWFDLYKANPAVSGDPFAQELIGRGRADLQGLPLLSVTPPQKAAAPAAPPGPTVAPMGTSPRPTAPPTGPGIGALAPAPAAGGGASALQGVDPEMLLELMQLLQERKRQRQAQQPGAGATGLPTFPGIPLEGPRTGFSPGHTLMR